MKPLADAWEQFLRTGSISDYHNYCMSLSAMPQDNETIEGEEYPDANDNRGGRDRLSGY
ncbi:MAG: hypothetical protein RR115_03920 [Hydrogenoanaerobacterium sp.]